MELLAEVSYPKDSILLPWDRHLNGKVGKIIKIETGRVHWLEFSDGSQDYFASESIKYILKWSE